MCIHNEFDLLESRDIIGHMTIRLPGGTTSYRWSIVTMCLSSTVMEIWPYEVLPGRFFQEQRSVVGRSSIDRSVLNITLILYTPLRYVRNVAHEE